MKTLFAWPTSRRLPFTSTASNGEPVATMARPSVQRRMSIGVASAAEVGFESGMTSGRSVPAASARRTRLVERAADPGGPDQDGRPDPFDGLDEAWELGREAVSRVGLRRQRQLALRGVEILAAVVDLPARIDQHECPADVGLVHPVVEHGKPDQPGDADPRGARPDQHDARVAQSHPQPAQPRQDPGHDDGRGPLDVVVERRHPIAVAVQDAQRIRLLEVLPLDDAPRPDLGDALDEGLDQRVVLGSAQARLAETEVERVGEERRVVGPDVERDRQT